MRRAIILAALIALPAIAPIVALGHPDLLAQIEELSEQLADHPGDASLLLRRGSLELRHGDYDGARRDFRAARAADPGLSELDYYEGRLELESGNPEQAVHFLDRYLEAHPGGGGAYALRARARLALVDTVGAADDFGLAIHHSEQPAPTLYRERALALVESGPDFWTAAQQVVAEGLTRFTVEISLLALGTDLALAQDKASLAFAYIDSLSRGVRELPQWQSRASLARALEKAAPEEKPAHLAAARKALASQATTSQISPP